MIKPTASLQLSAVFRNSNGVIKTGAVILTSGLRNEIATGKFPLWTYQAQLSSTRRREHEPTAFRGQLLRALKGQLLRSLKSY